MRCVLALIHDGSFCWFLRSTVLLEGKYTLVVLAILPTNSDEQPTYKTFLILFLCAAGPASQPASPASPASPANQPDQPDQPANHTAANKIEKPS
jgi:hypothetical protein